MLYNFPEEQRLIGKILTTYGDMEYYLANCVGEVIGDRSSAVRTLFRLRGGNLRVQVADAICRPRFDAVGLKDRYDAALGAIRYSTKIRNQYAHCHFWNGKEAGLYFTDLEKAAATTTGSLTYSMRHIDLPLLARQNDYVEYAVQWLMYLAEEYQVRVGKRTTHEMKVPQIIEQPPLHNPPEEHPLPTRAPKNPPPPEEPPPADH